MVFNDRVFINISMKENLVNKMKKPEKILDIIKNTNKHKLRRRFETIKTIQLGLIVALMLSIFEFFKKALDDFGSPFMSQFSIMLVLIALIVFIWTKFYVYGELYLFLKENRVDKKKREEALRIIEDEIISIEQI